MARFPSIDIFRGITVAIMILVNSMDDQGYSWLLHSPWNGCTLADLVFPLFVLIVGVSAGLSISALRHKGQDSWQIMYKIIKRTGFIFIVGLLINAFPSHFDLNTLRFCGVLQRIAICYFVASSLFLFTSVRTQFIVMATLLLGYWLAVTFIPVPGLGANQLTLDGNLAAYLDRLIIPSNHLYNKNFDPEGLFSTIPALATAITGNLLAAWLLRVNTQQKYLTGVLIVGLLAVAGGWLWGLTFPINKTLWSSSFVLWTTGIGLLLFALCYWMCDIKNWQTWSKPFELFGKNAMTAFVLHVLFLKAQAKIPLSDPEGNLVHLNQLMTEWLYPYLSPQNAALFFSLSFTFFWLMVLILLQKKSYISALWTKIRFMGRT